MPDHQPPLEAGCPPVAHEVPIWRVLRVLVLNSETNESGLYVAKLSLNLALIQTVSCRVRLPEESSSD